MELDRLIVLILDCQTTGANPKKGEVVELGWARVISDPHCDMSSIQVNSYLLHLPAGQQIPRRVQAITGITPSEIAAAHEPDPVWIQLLEEADEIARLNNTDKCHTVIHFAKFETPFLIDLHSRYSNKGSFPFKILCTHVMCKRLFPQLPRRSLRAMAGYFGHSLAQTRRCRDHILATAFVWQKIISELKRQFGINTFEQLQQWLDQPLLSSVTERIYPLAADVRSKLGDRPGIYRMYRSNGDILYVGKATSLRQRVNSYFRKTSRHAEHILEMLSQAKELDVTETETALEAAIFESDEIKRLCPPYNLALRKGGREVWFCSGDYGEFNTRPTARCRTGPFVSQEPMKRLAAIRRIVNGREETATDQELLAVIGIPEDYALNMQCIRRGWYTFLACHGKMLNSRPVGLAFKELGQGLWLQRQREKEKEIEESDEFELESIKIPVWTPESICHLIESNVARGIYEMRRARWLVLLSESALAWEEPAGQGSYKFLLVFEKGQVLFRRRIKTYNIPVPPGHGRSFEERQRSFDLMTLDRMRVVTTEMRKIVASQRWIRLRLSPDSMMDSEALLKVFKWV
jgi:DNA polymerase-3 subunit epsilon